LEEIGELDNSYRSESDVFSGTSGTTIPMRQDSIRNLYYPTASETSIDLNNRSNGLTATFIDIENQKYKANRWLSDNECCYELNFSREMKKN
jgi:hypothetical protein